MSSSGGSGACRACGSRQLRFLRQMPSLVGNHLCRFYRCEACGSINDTSDFLLDYSAGENSPEFEAAVHYYLEFGANFGFMTGLLEALRAVLPPRKDGRPARFLDVGAGMGFCVDIARRFGWEAIGVEPSPRGRIGGELLGVTILTQYLEDTQLPEESFDCVLSTEVLEHVADADAFLGTLLRYLAPDGLLLLTTPNADFVQQQGELPAEVEQVFSAGHHKTLYSEKGLRSVLERQGAKEVQITFHGGRSGKKHLVALAAKQPGIVPYNDYPVDLHHADHTAVRRYCEALIASRCDSGHDDMVYWGAVYRLFESYINNGDYSAAEPLAEQIDRYLAQRNLDLASLRDWHSTSLIDYSQQAPCFLGRYLYLRAMLAMNHQADLPGAEQRFRVAARICGVEESLPGNLYLGNLAEHARLHEAIALARQGKIEEALLVFDSLINRRPAAPPEIVERATLEKAVAMLAAGQSIAPALFLAELAARHYLSPPPKAEALIHELVAMLEKRVGQAASKLARYESHLDQLAGAVVRAEQLVLPKVEQWTEKADAAASQLKRILHQAEHLLAAVTAAIKALQPALRVLRSVATAPAALVRWPIRTWHQVWARLRFGSPAIRLEQIQALSSPVPRQAEPCLPLSKLVDGMIVEQTFTCPENDLVGVKLSLGSAEQLGQSQVHFALLDAAGQTLREGTQPVCNLGDGQTNMFTFQPVTNSAGKKYRIRLHSSGASPAEAVTLLGRRTRGHVGMFVNGKPVVDAQLVVEAIYTQAGTLSKPVSYGMRDLLIVTPDRLGAMRVGLGMRHWEIAHALSRAGLRVTLASTRPIAEDCEPAEFPVIKLPDTPHEQLRLARNHAAVMVQGTVLDSHPALADVDRPLIADMVCPLHIENLSLPEKDPYLHGLRAVSRCLQRGDFFICGNERQRLYWLGMLTAMGRLDKRQAAADPDFRHLVDVVRFGIPDQPPQKTRQVLKGVRRGIGADDFVLVWFGGIWDWLDPTPLIRAVHAAHQHNRRIKLFFSMYRRPNEQPHAAAVRARQLCGHLGAEEQSVFFNELPIPHAKRGDYLLECDLGVILQRTNLETALSARTRAMDYFWAGLPILINRGDEIAELVANHNMGIVLPSDDPKQIEQALLEYAEDRPRQKQAAAAVAAMAAPFRWSQTVKPLEEFCRSVIGQQHVRKAA